MKCMYGACSSTGMHKVWTHFLDFQKKRPLLSIDCASLTSSPPATTQGRRPLSR